MRWAATTCVTALLLTCGPGCAVLRIDVDVYKGPLANHPDVQMEQCAVMAIAAKPLLVELRDVLEKWQRSDPKCEQGYREDYMPPRRRYGPGRTSRSRFQYQLADNV